MFSAKANLIARASMSRSRGYVRRWLGDSVKKTKESTPKSSAAAAAPAAKKKTGWWHSAELWGGLGALAGWGMSGSAIYDAALKGPELISLTMTPVLIVYSSMFAYWSFIIIPKNYLLASCHIANVIAQSNQLRRGLEYKMESGQDEEVQKFYQTAAVGGSLVAGSVLFGGMAQRAVVNADLGVVSSIAAADAGTFTVHFWAPMSKWLIR